MGFSLKPELSVIVPAYNEVDNIGPLLEELAAKLGQSYEVVVVDDGSTDGTFAAAQKLTSLYHNLKVCRHPTNQGKTAAIMTGMEHVQGEFVCVLDADLQFRPEDVLAQVAKLREGYDLVTGRKVGHYEKRLVSSIYNSMARAMFGLKVRDINALKTFRREVLEGQILRKDWHRYIVPLARSRGFKIAEIPVELRPRLHGTPKYSGRMRILIGFFDLIAVAFQLSFMRKPMLYFGTLGMGSLGLGFIAGAVAIVMRIFGHGFRPLLYLVIMFVTAGLVFFAAGFLGEALAGVNDRIERLERLVRDSRRDDGAGHGER
jgi:glycosyltransferase involved in cell wall biosynthesis